MACFNGEHNYTMMSGSHAICVSMIEKVVGSI
jgi:hypothetical protein